MRKNLESQLGLRKKFSAVFSRFGKKVNYKGYTDTTILLMNVVDVETQTSVADHVWFAYTKGFEKIHLAEGAVIKFDARVKIYKKGYVNRKLSISQRQVDYKLSHPTNITVIQ
jgi:hypothetical protein